MWGVNNNSGPIFNSGSVTPTAEVGTWMSNYISKFYLGVISNPCPNVA